VRQGLFTYDGRLLSRKGHGTIRIVETTRSDTRLLEALPWEAGKSVGDTSCCPAKQQDNPDVKPLQRSTAHFLHAPTPFHTTYDAAGKLIEEYSTIVATTNDAKVGYLTNDHLGSPRANTDANGNVTARHDYHPFGEEIATSQRTTGLGYANGTVRKQFTGYERDGETELDFAQARYFNKQHGRFTSPDEFEGGSRDIYQLGNGDPEKQALPYAEIADPQTLNKYFYCRNNPLRFVDPTGHDWYEDFVRMLSNLWKATMGGPPSSMGTEPPQRKRSGGPVLPDEQTLTLQSWLTFGAGLDAYSRVLETADPTGIVSDSRRFLEDDTSGLAVSGIMRAGGPALGKLFGASRLFTGRILFGQNQGTNVAAAFHKGADSIRADILYVGGAKQSGMSTTTGALLKNIVALAKQEGARTVTVNAVAVINSKLAQKLEKAGWTLTKIKVAGKDELVDAYTKTFTVSK